MLSQDEISAEVIPPPALRDDVEEATEVIDELPSDEVAGVWVDPDSGELSVGVVEGASADKVVAALETQGFSDVLAIPVEHSSSDLDQIITGVYDDPGMQPISAARHDYVRNVAVLTSDSPITDDLREAVWANYGDAAVLQEEPVVVVPLDSRPADGSAFFAGAKTGFYGGGEKCTLGWSWINSNGNARMLTAGHCYPEGESNKSVATNFNSYFTHWVGNVMDTTVTKGVGTVGADGDLALINTQYGGSTLTNHSGAPWMWTGGASSSTYTSVNSVDLWAANGQSICYSGRLQGVQCGGIDDDGNGGYVVEDKDATNEWAGEVFTHLAYATKGWGKCGRPGESGSPVYINTPGTGVAAHGILSAASDGGGDFWVGKFEPFKNCAIYFTEIGQAYDHWGGGHVETQ